MEKKHGDFVRKLIEAGRVDTVHDVSDGGLLVAIAEMAMAGGIGASIGLAGLPDAIPFWFGEDQARYVIAAPFAEAEKIVEEARAALYSGGGAGQDRRRCHHPGRQGQRGRGGVAQRHLKAGSRPICPAKKFRLPTEQVPPWA